MTNTLTTPPVHAGLLGKRMLLGAAIALAVIVFFLLSVKSPEPEWGSLWMIKPLVIVPLAGAMGGVLYYMLDRLRNQGGWKTALAYVLSLIGYLFILWMGTVLGLNGTLWN